MAPLTRSRAGDGNVPSPLSPLYYSQRASAGLIVSEATQVSPQGVGYINTPGIHSPQQIQGWKKVTDAVHKKGGQIFLQLWHVGAISHPDFHQGNLPVAPSAVNPEVEVFTPKGKTASVTPRELESEEIEEIVELFGQGARNAMLAGFDGVEVHGANGYLPNQFLHDGFNRRTDDWGGSIENRCRFLVECTLAAIEAVGAERVGVRISPWTKIAGKLNSDSLELFSYLAQELDAMEIAYLHTLEAPTGLPNGGPALAPAIRKCFQGPLILNTGYDFETATRAIETGLADMISFGTLYISNPDLVERFQKGAPLATPDRSTYYGGTEHGYTDYPTFE
jgi:N-ethylmaleimide reductase